MSVIDREKKYIMLGQTHKLQLTSDIAVQDGIGQADPGSGKKSLIEGKTR